MKSAVCLLVPREGRFLSVSRRNDNTRWGMPGGKVDADESNLQAIQREVFEEVGMGVSSVFAEPLFVGTSAGDTDFWVTTYLWLGAPPEPRHLRSEEGLEMAFLTEEDLCNDKKSPFAAYNRRVFQAYHTYRAAEYAAKEKNNGS